MSVAIVFISHYFFCLLVDYDILLSSSVDLYNRIWRGGLEKSLYLRVICFSLSNQIDEKDNQGTPHSSPNTILYI